MRFGSQSAQAADARSQPHLHISSVPRYSGSSPTSGVPKAGQRRPLLPYPQLTLSLAAPETQASARRATSGPVHLSTHASKPVKPSHPQHLLPLAPPSAPTFRATITAEQLGPYSSSAPSRASHHLGPSYIPSHPTQGFPSSVDFGHPGGRSRAYMSAEEVGNARSSDVAPDAQGLTREFGRNEQNVPQAAEVLKTQAPRQGLGSRSRAGESGLQNNVEKPSRSFFKRPIRMKREKKEPPPPLNTQHISSPINFAGNDLLPVPPLSPRGISQTSSKPSSSRESSLSSLIKKSPLPPPIGRKLNTLLTAAARTIRNGDSKMLESYQASPPIKRVLVPRDVRQPLPQWQHDHLTTFSNPLKRIPVPAYNVIDPDDALLAPGRVNRTASFDRNRHARPLTADSKHSRTSSLPYNQTHSNLDSLKMQAHCTVSQPDLNAVKQSASEEIQLPMYPPIQASRPISYNGSDYLSTVTTGSASPDLQHGSHGNSGVITRTRERPPTLCYDDFRELVLKAMGRPLSGSYTASNNRISTLSQSSSARSRIADSRASVAGAAQISHQCHRKDLSLDARLSAYSKYQVNHPSKTKQANRHSYQSVQSSLFSCPPEKSMLLSKVSSDTSTQEVGPDKAHISRRAQTRPWSTAGLLSLGVEEHRSRSPNAFSSFVKPAVGSSGASLPASDGDVFAPKLRASTASGVPTGEKNHARRTVSTSELRKPPNNSRHSFHSLTIPTDLSPLERITDPRLLAGSLSLSDSIPHDQQPSAQETELRRSAPARSTPSVTHPTENLMFAVRGEIYGPEGERASLPSSPYKSHDGLDETVHAPALPNSSRRAPRIQANGNMSILVEDSDEEIHWMSGLVGTEAIPEDVGQSHKRSDVTEAMTHSVVLKPMEFCPPIELKDIALVKIRDKTFNRIETKEAGQVKDVEQDLCRKSILPQGSNIEGTHDISETLDSEQIRYDEARGAEEYLSDRHFTPSNSPHRSVSMFSSTSEGEMSRLDNGAQLRSSVKTISAETSLEMAASILGQPVPAVSREIWKSFERIHMQLEGRSSQMEEEELRWMLERLFSAQNSGTNFAEAAVQTDPTEAVTPAYCDLVFEEPPALQTSGTPRGTETVEQPMQTTHQVDIERAEDPVPDVLRESYRSEQSFKTALRESSANIQSYGKEVHKILHASLEQHSPIRTYPSRAVLLRKRVSDTSEPNQESSPNLSVRSPSKAYRHPPHSVYFPIGQLREAIRLEPHTSLLNHNLTSSPVLSAETVLEALDSALEAEEAFQREKHHLQSVARRQSQTIEGLLVDKEVLTLEVARLTGLVELLARDHNLLNERIDRAEQAYDDMHATASGHQTRQMSPAKSGRHSSAARQPQKQVSPRVSLRPAATSINTRSGGANNHYPNHSESASGEESGRLEPSQEGGEEDGDEEGEEDRESLCDPEQPSMIQKCAVFSAPPSPLPPESASRLGSPNGGPGHGVAPLATSPIPGSYPTLQVVPGLEA